MTEANTKARLVQLLTSKDQFTLGAVQDYLEFIGAPGELVEFLVVARELNALFPIIETVIEKSNFYDLELNVEDLNDWIRINTWILDQAEFITKELFGCQSGKSNSPFRGHTEEWPVYIAIYYRHPIQASCLKINQLKSQFLIAQHQFRFLEEAEGKNYTNTIKESSRLIRLSSDGPTGKRFKERQEFVEILPSGAMGMAQFWGHLQEHIEEKRVAIDGSEGYPSIKQQRRSKTQEYLHVIRRMCTYCLENLGGFTRTRHQARMAVLSRQVISDDFEDIDEGDANAPDVARFKMPSQSEMAEKESRQIGCNPEEFTSGIELVRVNLNPVDENIAQDDEQSPWAQIIRSGGVLKSVQSKNQLLEKRWNRLSRHEISVFIRSLKKLEQSGSEFKYHHGVSNAEISAVLTCSFWLSAPIARVLTAKAVLRTPRVSSERSNDCIYDLSTGGWIVGVEGATYQIPIRNQFKEFIDHAVKQVSLSNKYLQFNVLRKWFLSKYIRPSMHRGVRIFELNLETYEEAAQKFLSSLNRSHKTRLTLKRVADELFYQVFDECGDLVEGTYIFNRKHYLSKVQEYYAAPKKEYLETLYEKVCSNIIKSTGSKIAIDEFSYLKDKRNIKSNISHMRVGARHILSESRVSDFIANLWKRFLESTNLAGLNDYLIELHNDYTLYVVEMIAFCTGYRAVIDPLHSLDLLDKESGFLCISDKDGDDYYNSRIVWLPKVMLKQLEHYQQHRKIISQRLALSNPVASQKLKDNNKQIPFMFFLTDSYRPTSVRPALIRKRAKDFFPLPVNINRSYLRNSLREEGVSGEIVDYFMSHWDQGQEPFSSNSSLSPFEYVEAISDPLTRIIERDGWKSIPGLH